MHEAIWLRAPRSAGQGSQNLERTFMSPPPEPEHPLLCDFSHFNIKLREILPAIVMKDATLRTAEHLSGAADIGAPETHCEQPKSLTTKWRRRRSPIDRI